MSQNNQYNTIEEALREDVHKRQSLNRVIRGMN